MKRDIEGFTGDPFDLIIIGGGSTGACMAHDASLRGLRVALVEKGDFGAVFSFRRPGKGGGDNTRFPRANGWSSTRVRY